MAALVVAGEEAGTAHPAGRRGDEGVAEADSGFSQSVDVRCFYNGMSRTAQRVVPLVVGEEKQDVRFIFRFLIGQGGIRGPCKSQQK